MNTFSYGLIGNVMVVRFYGVPDASDNQVFLLALRESQRKVGNKVILCTILPEGLDTPSASQRENMKSMSARIAENSEAVHLVIPGDGVIRNVLRTIVRGVVVVSGMSGGVYLHSSFSAFAENVRGSSVTKDELIHRATKEGLLDVYREEK